MNKKLNHFDKLSFYRVFFLLSTLALLSLATLFSQSGRKTIKFATLAPKSSTWGKVINSIARDIYKESNKKLVLKVFYGGVQGDEKEMEEKIRFQQIDGGFFTGNGLGAIVDESRILEVPGLIKTHKELDHVYKNIKDDLNVYFKKKDYYLVELVDVGYAYFYSKKNVKSLADIRKSKMWLWKGDRFGNEIFKRLDIPAIPVSFTEVLPSLQTGLIDGVYTTPTALVSLQWYKEVNYMLDFPITLVSSGVVLSNKKWASLSSQEKKWVTSGVVKNIESYKPVIRKSDRDTLKVIKDSGIKINQAQVSWSEVEKQTGSLLELFPKPLVNKIEQLLKSS